jgi:predicted CXXCH cytochrome family protein
MNAICRVCALLLALPALAQAPADRSVAHSKHDLSAFGPGPVRAVEETEICIFCHVPHNASPAAPLWNRYNPVTYYRIYRSPTMVARVDQPGPASKLCLSCHDGSLALGLTLNRAPTDPIPMTHMYMPTGPSNLTNDLSDDHPIGFRYDRLISNRDPQIRQPGLVDHRIRLGDRGELECTACHDPHNNELGNFLRITDREGALCTTCHEMDGWHRSGHARSERSVPVTVTNGEQLPYRSMVDNACRSCHLAHSAPHREHLLYDRPSRLCITCHDGLSGPNILPVLDERSGHRVNFVHELRRRPGRRLQTIHDVECTDCHNPHAAACDLGIGPLAATNLGPLVPPPLEEVPGVSLSGVPVDRAAFYYEVCFRCHGDRAMILRDRIIRQRDDGGNIRQDFLPTAASAHPVAFPARQSADVPSLVPQVRTRRFISCQDCHNNPNARAVGGTELNGPHGSRFDFILVARYDTADFTMETPQSYALCYQCHDRNSILGDESFSLHQRHIVRNRAPCSACHAPHGVTGSLAQHDHLINFDLAIVGGQRFYVDTGRFAGACTLTCHGVQHVNFTYQP